MTNDQTGGTMTTISILPVARWAGRVEYQAVSGTRVAVGLWAGQALDALAAECREMKSEALVIVRRFGPDPVLVA
jgi:carbohydrate-selective porin OprB